MLQLDLKKEYKQLFNPSAKAPALVEVPKLQYLMLDGQKQDLYNFPILRPYLHLAAPILSRLSSGFQ